MKSASMKSHIITKTLPLSKVTCKVFCTQMNSNSQRKLIRPVDTNEQVSEHDETTWETKGSAGETQRLSQETGLTLTSKNLCEHK